MTYYRRFIANAGDPIGESLVKLFAEHGEEGLVFSSEKVCAADSDVRCGAAHHGVSMAGVRNITMPADSSAEMLREAVIQYLKRFPRTARPLQNSDGALQSKVSVPYMGQFS